MQLINIRAIVRAGVFYRSFRFKSKTEFPGWRTNSLHFTATWWYSSAVLSSWREVVKKEIGKREKKVRYFFISSAIRTVNRGMDLKVSWRQLSLQLPEYAGLKISRGKGDRFFPGGMNPVWVQEGEKKKERGLKENTPAPIRGRGV